MVNAVDNCIDFTIARCHTTEDHIKGQDIDGIPVDQHYKCQDQCEIVDGCQFWRFIYYNEETEQSRCENFKASYRAKCETVGGTKVCR